MLGVTFQTDISRNIFLIYCIFLFNVCVVPFYLNIPKKKMLILYVLIPVILYCLSLLKDRNNILHQSSPLNFRMIFHKRKRSPLPFLFLFFLCFYVRYCCVVRVCCFSLSVTTRTEKGQRSANRGCTSNIWPYRSAL